MALGHGYTPLFRVTPPGGAPYTVDVSGYQVLTKAQPLLEAVHIAHELVDRAIDITPYGYRQRARLLFEFFTPSASETEFAQKILTPAENDDYQIELSMDGGANYLVVRLEEFTQDVIQGKNIGITIATTWVCRDLLRGKPAVGSGAWAA